MMRKELLQNYTAQLPTLESLSSVKRSFSSSPNRMTQKYRNGGVLTSISGIIINNSKLFFQDKIRLKFSLIGTNISITILKRTQSMHSIWHIFKNWWTRNHGKTGLLKEEELFSHLLNSGSIMWRGLPLGLYTLTGNTSQDTSTSFELFWSKWSWSQSKAIHHQSN